MLISYSKQINIAIIKWNIYTIASDKLLRPIKKGVTKQVRFKTFCCQSWSRWCRFTMFKYCF